MSTEHDKLAEGLKKTIIHPGNRKILSELMKRTLSPLDISKITQIPRSTVYTSLKMFQHYGIVTVDHIEIIKGAKIIFYSTTIKGFVYTITQNHDEVGFTLKPEE